MYRVKAKVEFIPHTIIVHNYGEVYIFVYIKVYVFILKTISSVKWEMFWKGGGYFLLTLKFSLLPILVLITCCS